MKYLILAMMIITNYALADVVKDNNCKIPISSTGIEMTEQMHEKMRIDTSTIDEGKTKTELISNLPVTPPLAREYAMESYRKDPDDWISVKEYIKMYTEHNVRNLIIKFTYENKNKKQNVFLVSAFANDYECNIRFNGYITVKREF